MLTNMSETGWRNWIAAPDTQIRKAAFGGALTAICLIAACIMVFYSRAAAADLNDIVVVPSL